MTSTVYDHTSILKLIEWRWGLAPLTQRDASTLATDPGNLATALNLSSPDPSVPSGIPNPLPPVAAACLPASPVGLPTVDSTWDGLRASGLLRSWRI